MVRGAEPVKASATESVSTQAVKPSLSAHLVKAENLEKGLWAPWEGSVSPLVEEGPEVPAREKIRASVNLTMR